MNDSVGQPPIIEHIEYFIVRVPLLHQWASSPEFGHQIGHDDRVIVRLQDSDGYEGWGENILEFPLETLDAGLPHLLGQPLSQLRPSFLDFVPETNLYWRSPLPPSEYAPVLANLQYRLLSPLQIPVETALSDLLARRAGVPLCQWWGGAWRDKIKVDYWIGRATPEHAARCVARARQLGFRGIKIKTTLEDPNVERLEAIKEAGGENFPVTVDPNSRFHRLEDALPTIRNMDRIGNMRVLEDPFPRWFLDDYVQLRRQMDATLAVHIYREIPIWPVLKSGAAGCLNIDTTPGLYQCRMLAAAAEQANLSLWIGSNLGLGIGTAAQLHLAASIPNCQRPGDQMGPWLRESHLLKTDFELRDGLVSVPQGAGLGVEVDRAALDRYTQSTRAWQA
jgi:muconate cycloisomerase